MLKTMMYGTVGLFVGIALLGKMKGKKTEEVSPPLMEVAEVVQEVPEEIAAPPQVDESINLISRLFSTRDDKLPIVETIAYTSRVPWLKGRPAWITDYAAHFGTSRHFIARSLNGKVDYYTQKVASGNRFNVFKQDKDFEFYLLVDASRCKMHFYYIDNETNERVLLKTYSVGLGRTYDGTRSGLLTPVGQFQLGEKVAIYKPGVMGYFQEQETEMIQIFGTRWIPFEGDEGGYGFHGAPWIPNEQGDLVEERSSIGSYDSDGCVRLLQEDMEEIFSIVITKKATVEVVKEFSDADMPGVETHARP